MTIASDILALQTIHAAISGVGTAPPAMRDYPASLNGAQLPFVVVWPGEATWRRPTFGGLQRYDRTYLTKVYFCPDAQNIMGQALSDCAALLDAFFAAYVSAAGDGSLAIHLQLDDVGNTGDGGITTMTYAGVDYHGFEIHAKIHQKVG